jgi:hypothetical protein
VTYIVVIAAVLRELATRESGCIFALMIAGGSALTMPFRLPRVLRRADRACFGSTSVRSASVEQGS